MVLNTRPDFRAWPLTKFEHAGVELVASQLRRLAFSGDAEERNGTSLAYLNLSHVPPTLLKPRFSLLSSLLTGGSSYRREEGVERVLAWLDVR